MNYSQDREDANWLRSIHKLKRHKVKGEHPITKESSNDSSASTEVNDAV